MANRSLRNEIGAWDGKDVSAIGAVYDRQHARRGFVGSLVRLAGVADLEAGATWLLKHHLESGGSLSREQGRALFAAAAGFTHWAARLHALQMTEFVEIPTGAVRDATRLIERGLADENRLVRAWAYSGFARLAEAHPRYRAEAAALLNDAEASETAASVLARVRRVRKTHAWLRR